jgi:hypothetical protein
MSGSELCIPRNETVLPRYFQNSIKMFCLPISTFMYLHQRYRDTSYSRSVIPLFSCPLSWSVHYNFSGDGSCRLMMEAVVPSWKLSRLLTVAMSKQDFSARKLDCHFFIMVYKSLLTNVFATFCLILNKICGRK